VIGTSRNRDFFIGSAKSGQNKNRCSLLALLEADENVTGLFKKRSEVGHQIVLGEFFDENSPPESVGCGSADIEACQTSRKCDLKSVFAQAGTGT
jgi:hypothetical protein